eukprot:5821184-Amphidinium_carterae.1
MLIETADIVTLIPLSPSSRRETYKTLQYNETDIFDDKRLAVIDRLFDEPAQTFLGCSGAMSLPVSNAYHINSLTSGGSFMLSDCIVALPKAAWSCLKWATASTVCVPTTSQVAFHGCSTPCLLLNRTAVDLLDNFPDHLVYH